MKVEVTDKHTRATSDRCGWCIWLGGALARLVIVGLIYIVVWSLAPDHTDWAWFAGAVVLQYVLSRDGGRWAKVAEVGGWTYEQHSVTGARRCTRDVGSGGYAPMDANWLTGGKTDL